MDRYTMSEARAHFGEVLDAAEQGKTIAIERKGRRFILRAVKETKSKQARSPIVILDPSLLENGWTWRMGKKGLSFVPGRRTPK